MTYMHTMTSKGQITIPKEFRDKLGITKAGKTVIRMNANGEVVLSRPKTLEEIRATLGKDKLSPSSGKQFLTSREQVIVPQVMSRYPQYTPEQ